MPEEWKLYYDVLDVINQLLPVSHLTYIEGLPNLCCGFLVLVMLVCYFISREIPFREKVLHGAFLVFMFLSLNINKLDFIWHGMHFPNQLPHRFSFVICFLLVAMAYRAFNRLDGIKARSIAAIIAVVAGYYLLAQKILTNAVDDMNTFEDPIDGEKILNEPPVKDPEDGNTPDPNTPDPNAHVDDTPEPPVPGNPEPPVDPNQDPDPNNNQDDDPTQDDIIEAQQVGLFFDALGESLGWNMDEIDEKDRPLTVDQLTDYMKAVVNENSKPEYADDRIQALDEYVKNGGKFEDFYRKQQEALTLDNIDLEDENNQKAVVRELMQRSGYTDEQINKKISRYEDSDMLYEESEDALDRLKALRQKEVEEATR
jgi:hypothetical protein